jgi:hypothetical protein
MTSSIIGTEKINRGHNNNILQAFLKRILLKNSGIILFNPSLEQDYQLMVKKTSYKLRVDI